MPREHFRVKPYSDRRYKFVVRAKIDGKWRRRYFRNETEAQAYADKQNRSVPAKGERSRGRAVKNGQSNQAKKVSSTPTRSAKLAEEKALRSKPAESSTVNLTDSKAPKIARYLGGPWRMHLPFVYDLVRELNPKVFVELGVYKGESYFAVCQSVFENHLVTKCYGIDTWAGDLHSGLYCPEVGEEVASYNDRYSIFSRLLAKSFKEASREFADGSIDLLHIDGAHRYEDVKEDFEMWRPKLSKTGAVLFHDVLERDKGFGVYRLWQEIARPGASFLFEFGHGLGLWREKPISKRDVPFLRRLLLADIPERQEINRYYKTLAEEVEAINKLQSTVSEDQSLPVFLQVFGSQNGIACPEYASTIEILPSQWCRPRIDLPWGLGDGSGRLRIDPVDRLGLVDMAAVSLRSSATGEVLWSANRRSGLKELTVVGTALRLPHPRVLRLLAYGSDPQVCLPLLKGEVFQDPLSLEILLRFEPAPEAIDRAIGAWNQSAIISPPALEPPEAEAAMPFTAVETVTAMPPCEIAEAGKIRMVVYSAGESGYSEDRASEVTYTGECWSHLDIALQLGLGTKQLRLDPLTAIGLVDVASMTIRSAINDEVLWRANGGGGLETLQVSGSAVRIPHPHLARILSYGEDPQIYLPAFPHGKFDGPLRLEVWLKTETGIDSIRKGIAELAAISSRALAQDSETRGLLEQTTRDASNKESEIQSLRAELERTERERDAARAEVIDERLRHQRTLEAIQIELGTLQESFETVQSENASQQAQIESFEVTRGQLESDLTKARDEMGALKESLETVRLENATQQIHIENLEAIRIQRESDLTKLHESLHRARTETAQYITELEAERTHCTNLQGRFRGLETKQRQSEEESENSRAALAASKEEGKQQLETVKAALEAANAKLVSVSQELAIRASEMARVRHELTVVRSLRAGAAVELDQVRAQAVSATHHLAWIQDELSQLRNQLLGQKNTSTELRLKLDAAQEKLRLQESELAQLKASVFWKAAKPIRKVRSHFVKRRGHVSAESRQTGDDSSYAFWLEHPAGPSANGRNIIFSGWVIGPPQQLVYGVRAVIGGKIFPGEHGFERSDVGAAHESRVGATHAGFAIMVDLPPGVHDVSLEALNNKGQWKEFLSHHHRVNEPAPLHAGALERPGENVPNETDLLCITGWLYFYEDEVSELWANIKGGATAFLTHGLTRNDVAKILADEPAAGTSGFEGYLPLEAGFSGSVALEVYAQLKSGAEVLCFERGVTVQPLSLAIGHSDTSSRLVTGDPYQAWLNTNELTPVILEKMAQDARRIVATGPLISVIVPTYNTPQAYLEALIQSLRSQIYPKWQLCLADDASTQEHVRSILEQAARSDPRVKFVLRRSNGHIAEASNSALEFAEGDYIGLLDHDDLLTPDALLHIAEAISSDPGLDFLYTDEDKLSGDGIRYDPIFKGAFSPEMSLTHNYVQHFAVIRKSLVKKVGGFRAGFEGAQDLDLYLRIFEETTPEQVRHLPFVCYHWRSHAESTASTGAQKNYVFDSAKKSISGALSRRNLRATPFLPDIAAKNNCCLYQLRWSSDILKENPVTIIIPTKNRGDLLQKCIASLRRTVDPAHVSLIVVDDFSEEEETRQYLDGLPSLSGFDCSVIQPSTKSPNFNFSQLVNEGVARARTPWVLLLNNDTEAIDAGWLEDMAGWMSVAGVGAVGAKLLYPDGTIQHAGVIVGSHGGLAEHIFHRLPKDVIGFNFLTHAARNVTAVTAACMLTSKAALNSVNGFDEENFGMEYNDVDYCLRLGQTGQRIVFTPQAVLLHHCGKSRGFDFRPQEHVNFLRRYPGIKDAFYNESLDPDRMPVTIKPSHFVHSGRIAPLRILDVSHNLNFEGAPKVSFDRSRYLASEGKCKVTVLAHSEGPLRSHYAAAGIEVFVEKEPFSKPDEAEHEYIARLRLLAARLDTGSFDLIICSTLVTYWAVLLAKTLDLPVIWFIHESTSVDAFFERTPTLAGLIKTCLQDADCVAFEANTTRRLYDLYDERGNFRTLPGSVSVDEIDAFCENYSCAAVREKYLVDPSATVITLIGTTCARKGQHVFLRAIKTLQAQPSPEINRLVFLMLGGRESPYLDFLRGQLRESGVQNTLIVPECDEVYDYYRLSDIFVCASYQESFPRVILEAMAFKLGIVSTSVFGISEMIGNGEDGFLVSAGDVDALAARILWLAQNPEQRRLMGDKAHSKITRLFNSSVQLPKRACLAKEVVARHARHSRS